MTVYFTSDLHVDHNNIIKYSPRTRGHFGSLAEMNEAIRTGWNDTVDDNDTVYVLGDVSFQKNKDEARAFIKSLRGHKHLILGNHDQVIKKYCLDLFESVHDLRRVTFDDPSAPRGRWEVVMCHYPIVSWDKRHHGSIHAHGHCHGTLVLPGDLQSNMFDVGLDNPDWGFKPVSLKQLTDRWVDPKSLTSNDHHSTADPR